MVVFDVVIATVCVPEHGAPVEKSDVSVIKNRNSVGQIAFARKPARRSTAMHAPANPWRACAWRGWMLRLMGYDGPVSTTKLGGLTFSQTEEVFAILRDHQSVVAFSLQRSVFEKN